MDRFKMHCVLTVLLFAASVLLVGAPGAQEKAAAPKAAAPAAAPAKPAVPAAAPAKPVIPKVGDNSPNFTLKEAVTGAEIDLASLREKAPFTLITFTNSACSACRDEMDVLARLKEKQGKEKINMLAIFTDMGGEAGAKRAIESYKDTFVYLMDPSFTTPPMYGFQYTPATVIMDKKGKVVMLKGGFTADMGPEFSREIAALLK